MHLQVSGLFFSMLHDCLVFARSLRCLVFGPQCPRSSAFRIRTAADSSALGPSGVRYRLLKWAHAAHPNTLTLIFNLSLDSGTYLWKHTTVVVLNKPNKPDYSQAKAYWPISLLECTGKLMEKIITKRVNVKIETHALLPMTQFGSHPHHTTVDTVTTLF